MKEHIEYQCRYTNDKNQKLVKQQFPSFDIAVNNANTLLDNESTQSVEVWKIEIKETKKITIEKL